jgi:hypothetical protein
MPRSFVDLSIYLENDVMSDPPAFAPHIDYVTHENSAEQIASFFPGLRKGDLPDGEGWAVETVRLSTHNGGGLTGQDELPGQAPACRSAKRRPLLTSSSSSGAGCHQ